MVPSNKIQSSLVTEPIQLLGKSAMRDKQRAYYTMHINIQDELLYKRGHSQYASYTDRLTQNLLLKQRFKHEETTYISVIVSLVYISIHLQCYPRLRLLTASPVVHSSS